MRNTLRNLQNHYKAPLAACALLLIASSSCVQPGTGVGDSTPLVAPSSSSSPNSSLDNHPTDTAPITSCEKDYTLISQQCIATHQIRACTLQNGVGSQTSSDAGNTWGACSVVSCSSDYMNVNDACVAAIQTQSCTVNHGQGQRGSNDGGLSWGACNTTNCDAGYVNVVNTCVAQNQTQSCTVNHGTGTQTSTDGGLSWTSCGQLSCDADYTVISNSCLLKDQSKTCAVENGSGSQLTSDGGITWSSCRVDSCATNYMILANACVLSVQQRACPIDHGTGQQGSVDGGQSWSTCSVTDCDGGYTHLENTCTLSNQDRECTLDNAALAKQHSTDAGQSWGDCTAVSCNAGYHIAQGTCTSDTSSCSVFNGTGSQSWLSDHWSSCNISTCNAGYIQQADACAWAQQTRACTLDNGVGQQSSNDAGATWNLCAATSCDTGYHVSENACAANTKTCDIENGTGSQNWNGLLWSSCSAQTCNDGYTKLNSKCVLSNIEQNCSILNGTGLQQSTDGGQTWGSCSINCNAGYINIANTCTAANISQSCTIANGTGQQQSTDGGQSWSSCLAQSCNANFSKNGTTCVANSVSLSAPTTQTTMQCSAVSVSLTDFSSNFVLSPTDQTIMLATSGSGSFYTDANCSTAAVSTVNLPANTTGVIAYYKQTTAQAAVFLSATLTGFNSKSPASVAVTPGPAVQLSFNVPASVVAGVCNTLSLSAKDLYGNTAPVSASTAIALSGAGTSGAFYSTSACSSAITSATIAANTSSVTLYYKRTALGATSLQGYKAGFNLATQTVTTTVAPNSKLVFTTTTAAIGANSCVGYTLQVQDAFNNAVTQTVALPVTLSGAADGTYYGNSTCTTAAPTQINAAANSLAVYYKKPTAGAVTLTTAATALSSATRAITVSGAAPTKLAFSSAPTKLTKATCSGAFYVRSYNEATIQTKTPSLVTIDLSGMGAGSFYSNNTCTTAITSTTIAANGSQSAALYVKNPLAEIDTLQAMHRGGSLTTGTSSLIISSGVVTKLAFSSAPTSGNQNACLAYTVQTQDEQSIAAKFISGGTVNLTGGGTDGLFYSNSTCTTATTSVAIAANGTAATFYFKKPSPLNPVNLTATLSGYAPINAKVNVVAAPNTLVFSGLLSSTPANSCIAVDLITKNQQGTVVNVSANLAITLAASGITGAKFYADAQCMMPISSTSVLSATNTMRIYVSAAVPGSATFTATASGYTSANGTVIFQ